MSHDPVLHELLQHYGLLEYEDYLAADHFTIENLLQVKTDDDFAGFFEHFEITGFIHQNRFKTLINAIPALKRTNRIPASAGRPFDESSRKMNSLGNTLSSGFPSLTPASGNALVPFGGAGMMGMNPMMGMMGMNPMMGMMGMNGMNPMMGGMNGMNPMMGGMNGMNMMGMQNPSMMGGNAAPNPNRATITPLSPVNLAPAPKKKAAPVASVTATVSSSSSSDDTPATPTEAAAAGDEDDPFATEVARDGEQFGSVKPWVGTVNATKPDNAPSNNPNAPGAKLDMEWIYGFNCQETRMAIYLDGKGRIVYPAASILVAYDPATHTQTHYTGPTDKITCVAQCPTNPNLIAVGQCAYIANKKGQPPFITVFDLAAGTSTVLPAKHEKNIGAVCWNMDGSIVIGNSHDNDFNIIAWDWKKKAILAQEKAVSKTEVNQFAWNPQVDNEFCGVGKNVVAFYSIKDGKIKTAQGKFEQGDRQMFTSVSYTEKGTACVGCGDGSVYAFVGDTCKKVFKVSETPIIALLNFPGGMVSCAKGKVRVHDSKMAVSAEFNVGDAVARSVAVREDSMVIGTSFGEIMVVKSVANKAEPETLLIGHHDGELWAVAPHPDPAVPLMISVGEDNKLIMWDTSKHRIVRAGVITTDPDGEAKPIKSASSTTKFSTNKCARAICWSPDGKNIAIGTNDGRAAIYDSNTLERLFLIDLNPFGKDKKNQEQWIQCLAYNPAGTVLAVGTHGFVVVLLDVADSYKAKEKLTAHNSSITCLDWSNDGTAIQSVCMGYELLMHAITPNIVGSKQEKSVSKLKNAQWATQTCKFGWWVNGIFRPDQAGFDIMSVDRAPSKDIVATGETTKQINLFRYPCNAEGNKYTSFSGHGSHITCVRFCPSDTHLLSAGGADKCIIQWAIKR